MWRKFMGSLPPLLTLFGAVLSVLIPGTLYMINKKLHQYADPPWKRD